MKLETFFQRLDMLHRQQTGEPMPDALSMLPADTRTALENGFNAVRTLNAHITDGYRQLEGYTTDPEIIPVARRIRDEATTLDRTVTELRTKLAAPVAAPMAQPAPVAPAPVGYHAAAQPTAQESKQVLATKLIELATKLV
jgi:hypothetical protein